MTNNNWKHSPFMQGKEILPVRSRSKATIVDLVEQYEASCFEARRVAAGAKLFRYMIEQNDMIWLGVAGAGPAGGMGGYILDLIDVGFIDAICSTGAQVYHDAHFAFGLPVKQGCPNADNTAMDKDGTTRIYDINIRNTETLMVQDEYFQKFNLSLKGRLSTADYCYKWGMHMINTAPHPERSWVAQASKYGIPLFLDSESNHSIGMNIAILNARGHDLSLDPEASMLEAAAIVYANPQIGFFEWGGGGPKNWIQTIAPFLSQVAGLEFEGADRGLQITTANERDGGLSGCTFGEAVTWGKYKDESKGLVQIWGEYSVIAPIIVSYVMETTAKRGSKNLYSQKGLYLENLLAAINSRK